MCAVPLLVSVFSFSVFVLVSFSLSVSLSLSLSHSLSFVSLVDRLFVRFAVAVGVPRLPCVDNREDLWTVFFYWDVVFSVWFNALILAGISLGENDNLPWAVNVTAVVVVVFFLAMRSLACIFGCVASSFNERQRLKRRGHFVPGRQGCCSPLCSEYDGSMIGCCPECCMVYLEDGACCQHY
jgi:hypothetical protein